MVPPLSRLSLLFHAAGTDHSVAQIWERPIPLACFMTATSPVSVMSLPLVESPVVGLSGGMRQRSMDKPMPLALVTPPLTWVLVAFQKRIDSGPELVVLVYAAVCQALEAPKPRMNWFVVVALMVAVCAPAEKATAKKPKMKNQILIFLNKLID